MMYTTLKLYSQVISYVLNIFVAYPSYIEIQQMWSYIDIDITFIKGIFVTLEFTWC